MPDRMPARSRSRRSSKEPAPTLTHERVLFPDALAEELDAVTLGDEKRKERTLPLTEGALYAEIHNRPKQSLPPLAALCLSGGGIRSATFGLGVMQGLARCGLLGE